MSISEESVRHALREEEEEEEKKQQRLEDDERSTDEEAAEESAEPAKQAKNRRKKQRKSNNGARVSMAGFIILGLQVEDGQCVSSLFFTITANSMALDGVSNETRR